MASGRGSTYSAHLLNGNLEYDLLSIGAKTPKTGPDPPAPAIVGGLNTHGTFEGDASFTRADAFFGDNFNFNAACLSSMIYGNGFFNDTVAAEFRFHRIQESIMNNPKFEMLGHRHATAYGEAAFPSRFFVMVERLAQILANSIWPRQKASSKMVVSLKISTDLIHLSTPQIWSKSSSHTRRSLARNVNGINTFEVDHTLPSGILDPCGFYKGFVNLKIIPLYPNPTGLLKTNLIKNLKFCYSVAQNFAAPVKLWI
ncbi:hypothetical protein BKA70DRAFT_1459696 [Coprinopsis sp. MPI-PUGE-AT-0042]|nr:hypothetical protein BKA70DRAFT_1459696 [Coprinopsis sp. MPI-PUGE-AT-0042]